MSIKLRYEMHIEALGECFPRKANAKVVKEQKSLPHVGWDASKRFFERGGCCCKCGCWGLQPPSPYYRPPLSWKILGTPLGLWMLILLHKMSFMSFDSREVKSSQVKSFGQSVGLPCIARIEANSLVVYCVVYNRLIDYVTWRSRFHACKPVFCVASPKLISRRLFLMLYGVLGQVAGALPPHMVALNDPVELRGAHTVVSYSGPWDRSSNPILGHVPCDRPTAK